MRYVSMVQTKDGTLHASEMEARRHAEKVYGEALSKMAAKLLHITKYGPMHEFLEANLGEFQRIKWLQEDCQIDSAGDTEP